MTRVNLLLGIVLVASSLWLVRTAYDSRRLFDRIDKARNEQRELEADGKRLEADRQAQATSLRVERVARERLAMRTANAAVTQFVIDPAASSAVAASATSSPGAQP
jgi:cell division protein FtsL